MTSSNGSLPISIPDVSSPHLTVPCSSASSSAVSPGLTPTQAITVSIEAPSSTPSRDYNSSDDEGQKMHIKKSKVSKAPKSKKN